MKGVLAAILLLLPLAGRAAIERGCEPEYVDQVECNAFCTAAVGEFRTAVIFRDSKGRIIDWRWLTEDMKTQRLPDGFFLLTWDDFGVRFRAILVKRVSFTVSDYDVEMSERKHLPHEKRVKLRK